MTRLRPRLLALATPLLVALASPALAMAAGGENLSGDAFKPQNEFKIDPWIELKLGPIDMSINKAVFYVLLAVAVTTIAMIYIARRMQDRPNRVQTAVETLFTFSRDSITRNSMDAAMARKWFPFITTVFIFILASNLIGYIPLPTNTEHKVEILGASIPSFALYAATANISIPLALTLVVWFAYHVEGIRAKGVVGYFKGWVPAGVTGVAAIPLFGIEVISHFVRIISLSVRLFANILAGHLLILFMAGGLLVLLNVAIGYALVLGAITGAAAIAFYLFEVGLVAGLQAFIFAILTAIYLGEATSAEAH